MAQVKVAEPVKGADKLLRLEVDLGYEQRQILAGIAKSYEPEQLVGRKIVIVANLAPRKMQGIGVERHVAGSFARRRRQAGAGELPRRCAAGSKAEITPGFKFQVFSFSKAILEPEN